MRRVKLVVSDFHVGAGRRYSDGSLNTMENFVFDERFIDFIEYYSTGDYTNAEVELIINGDFFNLIQIEVDGRTPSDITEDLGTRQMRQVLDGHPMLFDALQTFAELPGKTIVFTIGNHDAALIWPRVKNLLQKRLGEQVRIVNRTYVFDDVAVEHGDRYDPVHAVDPKLPFLSRGLKEPILNLPWASYFFIHFVRKLKNKRGYIDMVKPFRTYLTWAAMFDFSFFFVTIMRLIFFVSGSILFGRVGHKRFGFGVIVMLIRAMGHDPELKAAKRILSRGTVNTVIFGHTHQPRVRQLGPGRQMINTGCWNGVTHLDIEGYGFQTLLTYGLLEWHEDRWLTTLRAWKGRARPYEDFIGG